jgi:hypothetical protein
VVNASGQCEKIDDRGGEVPLAQAAGGPTIEYWSDGMDPALTQNGLCMAKVGNEPSQRRAREGPRVEIRTLGIDLAKNLFRIHGVDAKGRTTLESNQTMIDLEARALHESGAD